MCGKLQNPKIGITLQKSVKWSVQNTPKEFEVYASGLAMLALDLGYIAAFLNCSNPPITTVDAVVQVDKTIMAVHETLLTTSLPQLIANSNLWQYQRLQRKSKPLQSNQAADEQQQEEVKTPTPEPEFAHLPELEDVVDFIIIRNFVEINGGSAEWNLIDKDDDEINPLN